MFAGKTTALIREAVGHHIILKPAMDTRYGVEKITSHDGVGFPAIPMRRRPDNLPEILNTVIIDEVQFLEPPWFDDDIIDFVSDLLDRGISVVAGGLDMDAHGRPFEITAYLAAMADEVIKLKAVCVVCGDKAGMTRRKNGNGDRVSLGGAESYEAVCRLHHRVND
jgi:thymidine kinase